MAKIRNISGEDRTIEAGRLVLAGAVIDVPDEAVYGFTQQSLWDPADADAEAAHAASETAYYVALAEDGQAVPEPEKTSAPKRGKKQED
jgi:hypothetical protein